MLIISDDLYILYDTGMGQVNPFIDLSNTSSMNFPQHLEFLGCTDIDIIITSYLHFDHTGWNVQYEKDSKGNINTNIIIPSWNHPTVYYVQNDIHLLKLVY